MARNARPVGPELELASGVGLSGPWSASLYRDGNQLICLIVREPEGIESGGCGSGTGPSVSGNGLTTTTVTGGTSRPDAAAARVTIVGGRQITLDLILPPAGVTEGVRYYVGVLPGTDVVDTVEIMGQGGVVLDRYPVRP
jgi:hypothetical protein